MAGPMLSRDWGGGGYYPRGGLNLWGVELESGGSNIVASYPWWGGGGPFILWGVS